MSVSTRKQGYSRTVRKAHENAVRNTFGCGVAPYKTGPAKQLGCDYECTV